MAQQGAPPRLLLVAAALSIAGLVLVLWAGFFSESDNPAMLYLGAGLFVISALLQVRLRSNR